MIEAQPTLEIKKLGSNYRLISFVRRTTQCSVFPYLNHIAELAESNQGLLESIIGAVSIVNRSGKLGQSVDYESLGYLSDSLSNEELNSFLRAVYKKARNIP